jgi:hypothetical protein
MKRYAPIGNFERHTTWCPLYIAWQVLDEARDYFRTDFSERYAEQLAQRAERVFTVNPFWQRRYKRANGREELLASMRHWLAGVLAREKPVLFRALPESYKLGQPLPDYLPAVAVIKPSKPVRSCLPRSFVHGWKLLSV